MKELRNRFKKYGINFINVWFVDILGSLKQVMTSSDKFFEDYRNGMGFDGSSVTGFSHIEESDLIAKPDLKTLNFIEGKDGKSNYAFVMANIFNPDGSRYEGDSRYVLEKMVKKVKSRGMDYYTGAELEYFYFNSFEKPELIDRGGYFDFVPYDVTIEIIEKTSKILTSVGINVEYFHHEVSFSQYEIDLRYTNAIKMADDIIIAKNIIKKVASEHNLYASFMPKPLQGINGSGMHTHLSLFKKQRNIFFDKKDENFLSKSAKYFLAGVLKYAQDISVVLNSNINSYKRLVPGFEAPVYIAWSRRNRSPLIRIPYYAPGKETATRMEIRNPDPAGNPYLQFAVLLGAGLKGIEEKLKLQKPREDNLYRLNELELSKAGIKVLPDSLEKAIDFAKKSRLLKEVLGEHIFKKFLAKMQEEWDQYRIQVTNWEIKKYFPIL